MTDKRGRI